VFVDEPPTAAENGDVSNDQYQVFTTRLFICGDLSFFAMVLGKENSSSCWCTWCTLSKAQCSSEEHERGELWMIQKIYNIRENVESNNAVEQSGYIMGCTAKPLFDAIEISNYIICILHIVIGIGNKLVDCLLEWVEQRVEKLTDEEIALFYKSPLSYSISPTSSFTYVA
jgi:hypothetical protein